MQRRPNKPGVDAADHVLSQQVGCSVARPGRLGQEKHHQAPHLEVVLAVVDEAPAWKQRRTIDLSTRCSAAWRTNTSFPQCSTVHKEIHFSRHSGARGEALGFKKMGDSERIYVSNICPSTPTASDGGYTCSCGCTSLRFNEQRLRTRLLPCQAGVI